MTNTNDSGPGSLRQAILDANANGGLDTIAFNIPGAGVHTITPSSNFDSLTGPVIVDGYTQTGSSVNTDPVGTNAALLIELDGTGVGGGFSLGLNLTAGGSTVQGLIVNGWATGIHTNGLFGGNVIRGNFLGTDATGAVAKPNGIAISISAPDDLVGGGSVADRNLVSGNTAGTFSGAIQFGLGPGAGGAVQGNLVGTDATGMLAIPNADGIYSNGPVTIGGSVSGTGNVISGNSLDGLFIQAAVVIQGNRIGTTADGTGALGNGLNGINIHESNDATVGGIAPGEANVIAYNGGHGVLTTGVNTWIRGNSIHDNGLLGIDLYTGIDTPKPNDPGDADEGSNHLQNFPIIQSVTTGATTHIIGKFNSTPATTFDLDFYANPACPNFPREFLEGETWLGTSQVTTDGAGNAAIDVTLPVATDAGARMSATATDPEGNTSEFSQRIIFSINPTSGPAAGGTALNVSGTDFAEPTTMTIGGVDVPVTFVNSQSLTATSPALAPGTFNDVVVQTPANLGILVNGWVTDFFDVPGGQQFHDFVATLVSNTITVGVGGGSYGVGQPTLRRQMAVFLLKARHGLCYVPPPCNGDFADVVCPSTFAAWIEALADEGISGGCGGNNFCPTNPVRRDQMAPFLLKAKHGSSYVPPVCTGLFDDVPCPSLFADWIEQLNAEGITGGCGGGYCPLDNATRGQMAVFVVKTFNLQ